MGTLYHTQPKLLDTWSIPNGYTLAFLGMTFLLWTRMANFGAII